VAQAVRATTRSSQTRLAMMKSSGEVQLYTCIDSTVHMYMSTYVYVCIHFGSTHGKLDVDSLSRTGYFQLILAFPFRSGDAAFSDDDVGEEPKPIKSKFSKTDKVFL